MCSCDVLSDWSLKSIGKENIMIEEEVFMRVETDLSCEGTSEVRVRMCMLEHMPSGKD